MTNNPGPEKTLVVVLGATATGKTDLSIDLAWHFGSEIVSADSRQFYREIPVGTAAPTAAQLAAVPHHMIANRSVTEPYSSGQYADDALRLLERLFTLHPVVFLTGGSGLYIDALCKGMDDMPAVDPELRESLRRQARQEGLAPLLERLESADPEYYGKVDRSNPQRVIRAVEVYLQTGKPYSSFRSGHTAERPFRTLKIGIRYPREVLYARINRRVELMIAAGLEAEARSVHHLKALNALQTVGYREFFDYFEGRSSYEQAVAMIKQNSRRYAKRQQTWFGRDQEIRWFGGGTSPEEIAAYIRGELESRIRK